MARKLLGKRAGESLVELAVSIAILSLIVLWAVSAFGGFSRGGQDLDVVGRAVSLADRKIETWKTYTLEQLDPASLPDWPASGGTGDRTDFPSPDNNLQYQVKRSANETAGTRTLIAVTLTVFDNATGRSIYVVHTSFLRGAPNAGV
jgi:type II secretory pathway pseudopilin PulG